MLTSTEQRTSEQGTKFDAALIRDFIATALRHDAVADHVTEVLHEHVVEGKMHPSVLTATLRPMIEEVLETATWEDWDQVRAGLVGDARETLTAS
jgi:hypothetical protein